MATSNSARADRTSNSNAGKASPLPLNAINDDDDFMNERLMNELEVEIRLIGNPVDFDVKLIATKKVVYCHGNWIGELEDVLNRLLGDSHCCIDIDPPFLEYFYPGKKGIQCTLNPAGHGRFWKD